MQADHLLVAPSVSAAECTCAPGGWCSVPLRSHYVDSHVTVHDGQAVFQFLALWPEEVDFVVQSRCCGSQYYHSYWLDCRSTAAQLTDWSWGRDREELDEEDKELRERLKRYKELVSMWYWVYYLLI